MSKITTCKRIKIFELWVDEYKTLCQLIVYYSDDMYKPVINPNLTVLLSRTLYDDNNNIIKEEKFHES